MSLILEALKKSEAQRRLGHAPGLMTPTLEAPHERGWWPFAMALLVVAVVAAAAAWWFARGAEVAQTVAMSEPPRPLVNAPIENKPAMGNPPAAAVGSPAGKPASGGAPKPTVPPPAKPALSSAAPPPMQAPPHKDPAFAANAQERESRPVSPMQVPPPAPRQPEPVAQTPPRAAETSPAMPLEEPLPALARLVDLPAPERQNLPPLRLSMHVYNAVPASRFAIIDGKRYSEGQAIADGLVVAEIRRDGVAMERGGVQFLLPRP